ncbi:MAG: hypothetical protein A3B68_02580 [Candidatus Melainabacteria bacterium RIFCSPHIGHO2_02_FULL_34_12]|nr:MAG: hypothetical protein A3B68_02580 [Candidatus Melainabacteria bacterium RIFCSPHIGHO2_02_FULL_34_12]
MPRVYGPLDTVLNKTIPQTPFYKRNVPNTQISFGQLTGRSLVVFSFGKFLCDLIFNTGNSVVETLVLPLIGVVAGSIMNVCMGSENTLPNLQIFPPNEQTDANLSSPNSGRANIPDIPVTLRKAASG